MWNIKKICVSREGVVACKLPQLNVSDPEITKFLHDVPPLLCTPEDWIILCGSRLVISNKAKKKYGSISCSFSGKLCETCNNVSQHLFLLHLPNLIFLYRNP